jgi:hypothetical protein
MIRGEARDGAQCSAFSCVQTIQTRSLPAKRRACASAAPSDAPPSTRKSGFGCARRDRGQKRSRRRRRPRRGAHGALQDAIRSRRRTATDERSDWVR